MGEGGRYDWPSRLAQHSRTGMRTARRPHNHVTGVKWAPEAVSELDQFCLKQNTDICGVRAQDMSRTVQRRGAADYLSWALIDCQNVCRNQGAQTPGGAADKGNADAQRNAREAHEIARIPLSSMQGAWDGVVIRAEGHPA